jgi:hypothetical protein
LPPPSGAPSAGAAGGGGRAPRPRGRPPRGGACVAGASCGTWAAAAPRHARLRPPEPLLPPPTPPPIRSAIRPNPAGKIPGCARFSRSDHHRSIDSIYLVSISNVSCAALYPIGERRRGCFALGGPGRGWRSLEEEAAAAGGRGPRGADAD